ncbi:MAG: beta-N-acetylhexosaminidase [Spirochaetales bacterium]|nr:beta-N-acetylhexosaminidase [Spirochaetales bacterium]
MTDLSIEKGLIPLPQIMEQREGFFVLNSSATVSPSPVTGYLLAAIAKQTGLDLGTGENPEIQLVIDPDLDVPHQEGYVLEVAPVSIIIRGKSESGLFHGIQTLRKLPGPEKGGDSIKIPACFIRDWPVYSFRGMHLDCCRHFMDLDFIKRYIDLIALYNMNVFHWHLTEDQGWRIEIKKYPKLTGKGAYRGSGENRYGGYYTQDEIREVIAYARDRYIEVIPEIDIPGHATAALAAYPEYSCTGGPFEVSTHWGIHTTNFCPGKEETFTFLQGILDEVMALFPSRYIHIGADEVKKDMWKKCPACQKRIRESGLKDEFELQGYFVNRMANYIIGKNRIPVGWNEILESSIDPSIIVQFWYPADDARIFQTLVGNGNKLIASYVSHCYFDLPAEKVDLRKVYSLKPVPEEHKMVMKDRVLGIEGEMWTEYAPQDTIDSKVFPRILALSEVQWTDEGKRDFDSFRSRVETHLKFLDTMGVNYGPII